MLCILFLFFSKEYPSSTSLQNLIFNSRYKNWHIQIWPKKGAIFLLTRLKPCILVMATFHLVPNIGVYQKQLCSAPRTAKNCCLLAFGSTSRSTLGSVSWHKKVFRPSHSHPVTRIVMIHHYNMHAESSLPKISNADNWAKVSLGRKQKYSPGLFFCEILLSFEAVCLRRFFLGMFKTW